MRAVTTEGMAAAASASGPDAVGDACREAVAALGGDVGLIVSFLSGEMDFARAAEAMQSAAGDGVPTAGLTGNGVITPTGPLDEGCVAVAFGPQVKARVAVSHGASEDLRAAGRNSTREALDGLGEPADLVLLFIDTTKGDMADTVSGAYEAAGPSVPLAGGAASGQTKRFLHMGDDSVDTVVAVALASERPLGIANTQSCKIKGTPSIVTRSDGQRVEEIDGRPAEEVYLEQHGLNGVALDDDEFESLAITHPLAQPELHGDVRLRHVLRRTGDGGIVTGTHIPSGAAIEFTELDFDSLLESGSDSVSRSIEDLGGDAPAAALVFDCAGRRRALREGLAEEVDAIAAALGDPTPPLAGLYTNGEVARLQGAKGDRNHAVVTVSFG